MNRYVTPRDVKTRTLCLFFLVRPSSDDAGGFVTVLETDLYTEAIVLSDVGP